MHCFLAAKIYQDWMHGCGAAAWQGGDTWVGAGAIPVSFFGMSTHACIAFLELCSLRISVFCFSFCTVLFCNSMDKSWFRLSDSLRDFSADANCSLRSLIFFSRSAINSNNRWNDDFASLVLYRSFAELH